MPLTLKSFSIGFLKATESVLTQLRSVNILVKIKNGKRPGKTQLANKRKPSIVLALNFLGFVRIKIITIKITKDKNKERKSNFGLFFVLLFDKFYVLLIWFIIKLIQTKSFLLNG